ncbi:cell wall metabolism sensor histidine kinase WalK, partial [Klebsiella pneumoniae]|nr:cell wall metabolism sensor histidine kinase WalK [Klebsiella pneumoniae]
EKGKQIVLNTIIKDSYLEIEIRDQGPGIAKGEIDCIFDRYWKSASSKSGGAGLGLAISKYIVDAHGGRIWADSQIGSG